MSNKTELLNKGFELSDKQIHVLLLRLDEFDYKKLYFDLTKKEKERADRLKIELKKKQFVVARSMLRRAISNSIDRKLEEEFAYGEHGKPFLEHVYNNKTIEFNISHSEQCVVIALTLGNTVGIDVEKINTEINYDSLSKRFFSDTEYNYLKNCDNNKKLAAFYRIWTRKEAFIKATGNGIAFGLDNFSVPGDSISKVEVNRGDNLNGDWYCFNLMSVNQYETALVTNNKEVELTFYQ